MTESSRQVKALIQERPNVKLGTRAESLTTLEKTAVGVSSFTLRK